jgi:hypothetical protein
VEGPSHILVHATEPDFEGLGVVHAVDRPVVDDLERVAKVEQEVVGGHRAAGEEVFAHPVVVPRGLEVVGEVLVQEDVDKQEAALLEPAVDVRHQLLVVLHVLEHFDAHDLGAMPNLSEILDQMETGAGISPDRRENHQAA